MTPWRSQPNDGKTIERSNNNNLFFYYRLKQFFSIARPDLQFPADASDVM